MIVDSYRYLPRSFVALYENPSPLPGESEVVWAPFGPRLAEARIGLVTSAGLHLEGEQEPFDAERERREPTWGDPTHRVLPASLAGHRLGMTHLHVNPTDVLDDPEIALPTEGLAALVAEGRVGSGTSAHVSVMGYQEAGLEGWRTETAPAVVELFRSEHTDGVVLAPV